MATMKSREKGKVSLTQIKVLAAELKKGYPTGTKYKDSRLVYSVSKGWGQVKFVGNAYRLREGEHELADVEKLQSLVKGFYNQNKAKVNHEQSVTYLSNEIQKMVLGLSPINKATKAEALKIYEKYVGFKEFYQKVACLQGEFFVDFTNYDFMTADMYRANEKVTAYMKKLGTDNNLEVAVFGPTEGYYRRYVIEGFKPRNLTTVDVYLGVLTKFLDGNNLTEERVRLLTDLFVFLYRVDKEDFVGLLASGTGEPYLGLVKEFTKHLEQGMAEINIEGLTNFKVGANKLIYNREAVKGLGRIRGN